VRVGEEEEDLVQLWDTSSYDEIISKDDDAFVQAWSDKRQFWCHRTCPFSNQLGKCFIAFTRAQAMFLYWPARAHIGVSE
jgi:hypothetical protein